MKTTKLQNGWELILDSYSKYAEVFINTKQPHPFEDTWLIIAYQDFATLEEAEEEYQRLLERYNNELEA